ncbi:hypothetical protein J6590_077263 [Homalodisca vitripennis]|nr:hypothetical protein J6590_077263 [Homalodisca vitripennis]
MSHHPKVDSLSRGTNTDDSIEQIFHNLSPPALKVENIVYNEEIGIIRDSIKSPVSRKLNTSNVDEWETNLHFVTDSETAADAAQHRVSDDDE